MTCLCSVPGVKCFTHLSDWEKKCLRFHGRVLTGAKGHWCYEWDDLPVDETTEGYEHCGCLDENGKPYREAQK